MTPIKLVIDDEVFRTELAAYQRYVDWCPGARYFNGPAGTEPYRLLARLAQQLPPGSTVADCGTLYGCSAIALAINPSITVNSYDITDYGACGRDVPPGADINYVLGNCLDHVADMVGCQLIHLDIDPHNGVQEEQFYGRLVNRKFAGVLLCDDINLNFEMRRFWTGLNAAQALFRHVKCIDASRWGHHSGTGVVVFDPETIDVEVK
jgi:hypothetical protein